MSAPDPPTGPGLDPVLDAPPAARRRVPYGLVTASALALLILAIAVGVAATGGDDGSPGDVDGASQDTRIDGDPIGQKLPEVSMETFDGESVTFADYEGTPLVVNFFASWCPPCIAEMPDFEQVHQTLGDDVLILGVNSSDRLEDGLELVEQTGVTYAVVRDERGDALAAVGGAGMPTTFFVDADGTIVDYTVKDLDEAELTGKIQEALGVPG